VTAAGRPARRPPRTCPVCTAGLLVTRLGCPACETELSGVFESCEFCGLGTDERELLRVFLVSRGNMKELERHLGVSYPTARARYDELLGKLGLSPAAPDPRLETLEALARGDIDTEEATRRLS
jgi:hypothetical protein